MEFIDLATPYRLYGHEIEARMRSVIERRSFILGPEVAELEAELSRRVGVKHAITTSSGTSALELALRALGVGPGDEVITVAFSWISPAEVICLVGATPVFVDIDPRTFTLDARKLESAITPRTKAILLVSLFGQMPDIDDIARIATERGLAIVEDGAQSFGATQRGRSSGAVGRVGCTSFFPSKPLGCFGDGGALFTDDAELAETLRALRTHGALSRHEHRMIGTNARFDTLQAAVLLAKLPHFEGELAARARVAARYDALLGDVCQVPHVSPGNTHVYAQYTLRVPKRDAFVAHLAEQGIPTAVHYAQCLHEQPALSQRARWQPLPESERAAREVVSLPMHPYLSEADQDRVARAARNALASSLV